MGRSPPAPLPRAHMSVCTGVYIYICIYIYTYIYTLQAHPCTEAAAGAPQACAPRAHVSLHAHVCPRVSPHAGAPPAPSARTAQVGAPQVCMDPPSTCTGGAWVPPKAITPPTACGCRGGTPRAPRAPTKECQPMEAPLWHSPPRAPPPAGVGGPPAPRRWAETPWGGAGD